MRDLHMRCSTYRFALDLQKHQSQMSIAVYAHDSAVRFYITLTDGGLPYYIEDGCRAVFYAKRPDGEPLIHNCMIEGNRRIIYDFNESTAKEVGITECQIHLYGADGRLISAPRFIIVVDERVVTESDLDEEDEKKCLSALDELFASEIARDIAENGLFDEEGNLVEGGRVQAEEARVEAEKARDAAEKARDAAEKARETPVVNITSIDTIYNSVEKLPFAENGTTYLVINDKEKAIYSFSATEGVWSKKDDLKSNTAYIVLQGEKAGIYRYINVSPYIVSAESHTLDEAKAYTDDKVNKKLDKYPAIDTSTLVYGVQNGDTKMIKVVERNTAAHNIVARDDNGEIHANAPTSATAVANKSYVDKADKVLSDEQDRLDRVQVLMQESLSKKMNAETTTSDNQYVYAFDKDGNKSIRVTSGGTGNTIPIKDGSGNFFVGSENADPPAPRTVVNKAFVERHVANKISNIDFSSIKEDLQKSLNENALAVANQSVASAVGEAKTYADGKVSSALSEAKTYAENVNLASASKGSNFLGEGFKIIKPDGSSSELYLNRGGVHITGDDAKLSYIFYSFEKITTRSGATSFLTSCRYVPMSGVFFINGEMYAASYSDYDDTSGNVFAIGYSIKDGSQGLIELGMGSIDSKYTVYIDNH